MKKKKAKAKTKSRRTSPAGAPEQRAVVLEQGARKKRTAGRKKAIRLSTHKRRASRFRSVVAWPFREARVDSLVTERRRTRAAPAAVTGAWRQAGPTNIGGRATAIAADPRNPLRIWLGAAGGGVWYSADGGLNWTPQWHAQDILNIGALALDPANPDVLYAGTGEANASADSYAGVGLYVTRDAGRTWSMLASVADAGVPRRIGVIAVDPFNSAHLLLGGIGHDEVSPSRDWGGLFESRDGGLTWVRKTFAAANNYWCHSIVFHPVRRDVIFATVTEEGARSGVYKSTDGGTTWLQLKAGLPAPERFGRASVAISPSRPAVMYLLAADTHSDAADQVLGVFRSDDEGAHWTDVTRGSLSGEGQMSYNNALVVHPTRPGCVLCGGVDLHLTQNAGGSWKRVTRWDAARGSRRYAHADHHALLMPAAQPGLVYDVNDGGLDVSLDGGLSWENRSRGLDTIMFYDADVSQMELGLIGGGAQDNGTLVTTAGRADAYTEILGGDGGWIVFDPRDAHHLYASAQNMYVTRWARGRARDVSPPASEAESLAVWMVYITFDPSNSQTVFLGSTRIWRTRDDGVTWKGVSPHLDGSPVSAIEVSADGRRIYVGTENGGFFRSLNRGRTWSANLSGSDIPGHHITRIESHPADPDLVYLTVGNRGHGHVFSSTDGGLSWRDVDNGKLPDVPHWALLLRPDDPVELYVCNDVGVFVTRNNGVRWRDVSDNLPNAMATDLVYQERTRTLFVATYGRSIWKRALR